MGTTSLPEPTWAFQPEPTAAVLARLLADRPRVVGVDGRSGAGKTTLAALIADAVPGAAVAHTDDLQWHEAMFEYAHHLQHVVDEHRAGRGVDWQPPQWVARGREDRITLPAGAPMLVVEGCGAGDRRVRGIDAIVWVHSDDDAALARGLARDMARGDHHDLAHAEAFWAAWAADELAHYRRDLTWRRAALVVDGTPRQPVPGAVHVSWPTPRPAD